MVYFLCKASDSGRQNCCFALSLPVRGAWVEIVRGCDDGDGAGVSLPVRGAWVEISFFADCVLKDSTSLPVRGAWVEMATHTCGSYRDAPSRSPCGERGLKSPLPRIRKHCRPVAPRAGSVG